jgi:hypothetical protein
MVIAAGGAALLLSFGDIRLFPLFFIFTLAFGLVLGLPLYFIVRPRHRASWKAALIAGFFVGAAMPALLVLAGPAADQASIGGVATVIDGHYTGYGLLQNFLFVAMFGAFGGAGGLLFWSIARRAGRPDAELDDPPKAAEPWSGGKIGMLCAGAAAVLLAAVAIPVATKDRTCHNTLRDGRSSIGPEASFDLTADARDWRSIAGEVEAFGRAGGWSILSDVRPDGGFQWFQISLCKEPGTNIAVDGMADWRQVSFTVYQPQGGSSWRAPFAELYARVRRRWPDRIQFRGPRGEPTGPPAWVPREAQSPGRPSPPGNSSAL